MNTTTTKNPEKTTELAGTQRRWGVVLGLGGGLLVGGAAALTAPPTVTYDLWATPRPVRIVGTCAVTPQTEGLAVETDTPYGAVLECLTWERLRGEG